MSSAEDDLALARMVRDMPREAMPERDLWQGIERRIVEHPQTEVRSRDWMPYAVAASLVIAVSSLMLNVMQPVGDEPQFISTQESRMRMETEYLQVRNPLVEQFNTVNQDVDEQTMTEVHRNLEILKRARQEIEAAVREEPDNPRLLELLMSIHEQELELLQQDYGRPARFM